jgi:hypothetical protein
MFHSFFLSALPLPQNEYPFGKKQFFFNFSQILKLDFLILFFHIHFLGPIMHNLTKSHDFNSVFWSSGIQYKQPIFTVGAPIIFGCLFWIPELQSTNLKSQELVQWCRTGPRKKICKKKVSRFVKGCQ